MKTNLLKVFALTLALGLSSILASAQTKEISHDFSAFDAIDVDYDFNVSVVKSKKDYSVEIVVDDVLADYVQTYVKSHTLYITLDKKSLPSDIKKLYKGRKSADPVLNATVYLPGDLSSVTLAGAAIFFASDEIECKDFELNIKENAKVTKLSVDAAKFTLASANKASADILVYADEIELKADGNSIINIEQDSEKLHVNAGGNSTVNVKGEAIDTEIKSSVSGEVILTGKTNSLNITTSGTSRIDALNFHTPECTVNLSGNSKVTESATENLHVTMAGGSTLTYDGNPVFDIVNVKNSSIIKFENAKK